MKILHVVSSFPPAYAYGGPVESSYKIAKNLVNQGHEVTVFTTDVHNATSRYKDYTNPEYMDGIRVFRFRNTSNKLAWNVNISTAVGIWPALRTELSEFDLVHLHEFRSVESAITSFEASRQGVPIILQPRGSIPRKSKSTQKQIFDQVFGKRIMRAADHLIASSSIESSQYTEVFPFTKDKPISHVPNGIDRDEYNLLPEEGRSRKDLGISKESELILYLGRIHERKGIDLLIHAFANMNADCERHLAVVGPNDGFLEQLQEIQQELGCENIHFPGPRYGEEKLTTYVDADVFVLPSKNEYESFGNVVLEAMACGTPVVCTDVCGVSEWIEHEDCQVCKPSSGSLSEAIKTLLESTSDPTSLREYVHENFSWEAVAEETEDVYEEVHI
jgi:glycosyltransferase involved in cell wall biosynthesis